MSRRWTPVLRPNRFSLYVADFDMLTDPVQRDGIARVALTISDYSGNLDKDKWTAPIIEATDALTALEPEALEPVALMERRTTMCFGVAAALCESAWGWVRRGEIDLRIKNAMKLLELPTPATRGRPHLGAVGPVSFVPCGGA